MVSAGVVLGTAATAITLLVFLLWAYREFRRVDDFAPAEDEGDDG